MISLSKEKDLWKDIKMAANIEKALPYFLLQDSALAALIVDRLYPYKLPQNCTLPAVSFQDISETRTQSYGEASALPFPRYQFTITGGTVDSVKQVEEALNSCLDGYQGTMGTGSYITEVEAVILKNRITNNDIDLPIFQRMLDYVIQYKL